MRLISCHIENFGRLHDCHIDFDRDINVLCRDNGWGKSTLAAFLRVMFFGLQNESKRSNSERERVIYRPWQGGVYGGKLTFEVHGKKYIVTRQFKEKANEDFFELRDGDTNLISGDFTENLGEEIFQINNESFIRTVFISQNDCVTNTTDSINAKIGNISDNTGDIDSYENAMNILKTYLNHNSPKSAKGSIRQKKEERSQLYNLLLNEKSVEDSLRQYEDRVKTNEKELEAVNAEKSILLALDEKLRKAAVRKSAITAYETLVEEEKAAEKEVDSIKASFSGKIPSREEYSQLAQSYKNFENYNLLLKNNLMSDEETNRLLYLQTNSGKPVIEFSREEEERLSTLSKEFGGDGNYFDLASQITADYNEHQRTIKELDSKKLSLEYYKDSEPVKKKSPVIFIIGILLIILAAVSFLLNLKYPGIVLGILGLAAGAFYFILPVKKEDPNGAVKSLLQMEIETLTRNSLSEEEKLIAVFMDHGIEAHGDNLYEGVTLINRRAREYEELRRKKESLILAAVSSNENEKEMLEAKREKYASCQRQCNEAQKELDRLLTFLGYEGITDYTTLLDNLNRNIDALERALANLRNRSQKRDLYYEENDSVLQEDEDEPKLTVSPDEITDKLEKLADKENDLKEKILSDRHQLEALYEKSDELSEMHDRYDLLEKEIESGLKKYALVEKTQSLLLAAKEKFTNEYSQPLLESFLHYYSIVVPDVGSFNMDANSRLTVDEYGLQRNVASLSQGLKDAVGLCLRVALVEAMYPNERPVIFLDDPFVNLDDDKMEGAGALLKEISSKYQLVYFTCTKTRSLF